MTQMPRKAEHMPNIVDSGKDDTCGRRHCSQAVAGTRAAQQHIKILSLHGVHALQKCQSNSALSESTVSVSQSASIKQLVMTAT